MKLKSLRIFLFYLFLISVSFSCNESLSKKSYPQIVSKEQSFYPVNSCYEVEFDSIEVVPNNIQLSVKDYLKDKLSKNYFSRLNFELGYIHSDIPLPIKTKISETELILYGEAGKPPKTDCDSTYKYPVYWLGFDLPLKEKGIQKLGFNVIVDNSGKIIGEHDLPKIENDIISIDSIHSLLITRNIPPKKLNIRLAYDQKSDALFWFTSTLIQPGSILEPSCFPISDYHFKMNAVTGEVINYNSENDEGYFEN